jgi:hypothetical protein
MARLEELQEDAAGRGILPGSFVTVVDARWHGGKVLEMPFKEAGGKGCSRSSWGNSENLELLWRQDVVARRSAGWQRDTRRATA